MGSLDMALWISSAAATVPPLLRLAAWSVPSSALVGLPSLPCLGSEPWANGTRSRTAKTLPQHGTAGHETPRITSPGRGAPYAGHMSPSQEPLAVELRDVAVAIATNISAYLAQEGGGHHVAETKSSPADYVTAVDKESERRILEELATRRPDDAVLGEEGADRPGTSGVRWIIDPIDGTTNFVYGMPGYSVSIAAEVDGTVMAGAVADPVHQEIFEAYLGGGARLNGTPISTRTTTDLAGAVLATGFSSNPERRVAQTEALVKLAPHVGNFRRFGSAAVDLCWVACGRVDGYWESGLNIWDYAAGVLVASEAGGHVSDGHDGLASSVMTVALAPGLAAETTELLRRSGAV